MVLSAWTALEVLSPPSFQRPEQLAFGGDRRLVARIDGQALPWENGGEKSRPNMRLYYQVVLGTVDMENAISRLLATFPDSRAERPVARGEAILAIVIVDQRGCLAVDPAIAVSSFGWGVPRALQGNLTGLAEWPLAEKSLVEGLTQRLRPSDDAVEAMVNRTSIMTAYQWLVATLGLPNDFVKPPQLAIRCFEYFKNSAPPDTLLLNSFFLNDLARTRELFAAGKETPNLRRYLGVDTPASRKDLLEERVVLDAAVAPQSMPVARWPGAGRHSLVLLQQAAVNLAMRELSTSGLLAVNGPPGTGKTTLLRDMVAALVTARAEIMATFSDPASAFTSSGERLSVGQKWLHLYRLDDRLKGFEMLVASSNNKAVENVSAELPMLKAVADDIPELRYFSTLSDALFGEGTWGAIAAVLGNAANRGKFKQTFWWDEEAGLSTYLAAAAGTPQFVEHTDPKTQEKVLRTPRIISAEQPPTDHASALVRWAKVRQRFKQAVETSRRALAVLEKVRADALRLPELGARSATAAAAAAVARTQEQEATQTLTKAQLAAHTAAAALLTAQRLVEERFTQKPGFLARLFRTKRAVTWRDEYQRVKTSREAAQGACDSANQIAERCKIQHHKAMFNREGSERSESVATAAYVAAQRDVEAARNRLGKHFVDDSFFEQPHGDRHTATPWLDDATQRLRDDAFTAAIALQRAFVDAAAKPLRHNLGALMNVFSSGTLSTPEKQRLVPDLWRSFFLVVPVVSTTFASVDRMLGTLPPETLGWLFIDEAGQALPQAAVGALMRTRRAVVVGDPVQIEPVVALPESLTQLVCRRFGIAPERFNAPEGSTQTLADAATPYYAEFEGRHGSRTVGVPLLVHRRCAEPMFSIANHVAYERLMVQAKTAKESAIRNVLGASRWIDVEGDATDKWCAQEGEIVLGLLRRLAAQQVNPDLYIITPFVVVADNLRKVIVENRVLSVWTEDPWSWVRERVGTVHTVQGREAEAVIFVLGAPLAHQTGARGWAGARPNLLNVAVTRAKEAIYVVGNRRLWAGAGVFRELNERL
jgi:hypothetical protein